MNLRSELLPVDTESPTTSSSLLTAAVVLGALCAAAVLASALVVTWRRWRADRARATWSDEREVLRQYTSMLGQPELVLRLPALQALERLAHEHPDYRQPVTDVLCHYLRENHDELTQRAAQRIVTDHLRPATRGQYWGALDLDLSGAHLERLDLRECRVGALRLHRAHLTGETTLGHARIKGIADFTAARFTNSVDIQDVHFDTRAEFTDVEFAQAARFDGSTFQHTAVFAGAHFAGPATYTGAVFLGDALFSGTGHRPARFGSRTRFDHTCFMKVEFGGVVFTTRPDFSLTEFGVPTSAPSYPQPHRTG
jgi:hypothetical protein